MADTNTGISAFQGIRNQIYLQQKIHTSLLKIHLSLSLTILKLLNWYSTNVFYTRLLYVTSRVHNL